MKKDIIRYSLAVLLLPVIILCSKWVIRLTITSGFFGAYFGIIGLALLFILWALLIIFDVIDFFTIKLSDFVWAKSAGGPIRTYSMAEGYEAKGKYLEAIMEYQKLLEEDSTNADAQFAIANICAYRLKNYTQAIEEFYKVLDKKCNNNLLISTIHRLADIYSQEFKKYNQAILELQKIIEKFPHTKSAQRAKDRIKEIQRIKFE